MTANPADAVREALDLMERDGDEHGAVAIIRRHIAALEGATISPLYHAPAKAREVTDEMVRDARSAYSEHAMRDGAYRPNADSWKAAITAALATFAEGDDP